MFHYIKGEVIPTDEIDSCLRIKSKELICTLLKIYLFSKSPFIDKWKHEVWKLIHDVPKLRGLDRFPSYNLIRDSLHTYINGLPNLIIMVQDTYSNEVVTQNDIRKITTIICKYLNWLSIQLSKNGKITYDECQSKLQKLNL